MTEADVVDRLIKFIEEAGGAPLGLVIKDRPGATRPAGAHAIVGILTVQNLNEGELVDYRVEGVQPTPTIIGIFEEVTSWRASVDVYASEPTTIATNLVLAFKAPFGRELLGPNLVVREVGPANRLPALVAGKWEGRATFTVTLVGTTRRERVIDEARTFNIRPRLDPTTDGPGINFKTER